MGAEALRAEDGKRDEIESRLEGVQVSEREEARGLRSYSTGPLWSGVMTKTLNVRSRRLSKRPDI